MPYEPSARPGPIGYVLKMYPRFSETFVVSEILARTLRRLPVSGYCTAKKPCRRPFHAPPGFCLHAATSFRKYGLRRLQVPARYSRGH